MIPPGERDAIMAAPGDPRTEYVPASAGVHVLCGCPRTVLDADDEPRGWRLKVYHERGCPRPRRSRTGQTAGGAGSGGVIGAYLAALPAPIPCPRCGGPAHTRAPGGGRCCHGCGHVWAPGRREAA